MKATVTTQYIDRETGAFHAVGEEVELTEARAGELAAGGFVAVAAATADEVPAAEMTAAQMREAIAAKGGEVPKRATKAQLAAILADL